jgi:hypothetical protein
MNFTKGINGIKSFNFTKFFDCLNEVGLVKDETNVTNVNYKYPCYKMIDSETIKEIIMDSNLIYWKSIIDSKELSFDIVGLHQKNGFYYIDIAIYTNAAFDKLFFSYISFSDNLEQVFPEIEKIKKCQELIKVFFQMYRNKIVWSPKSLGGIWTKKQIRKLFL